MGWTSFVSYESRKDELNKVLLEYKSTGINILKHSSGTTAFALCEKDGEHFIVCILNKMRNCEYGREFAYKDFECDGDYDYINNIPVSLIEAYIPPCDEKAKWKNVALKKAKVKNNNIAKCKEGDVIKGLNQISGEFYAIALKVKKRLKWFYLEKIDMVDIINEFRETPLTLNEALESLRERGRERYRAYISQTIIDKKTIQNSDVSLVMSEAVNVDNFVKNQNFWF